MDFAVDVQLAQASGDQLGYLATEIDDEKAVMLGHGAEAIGKRAQKGKGRAWVAGAGFEYLDEKEIACRIQPANMSVLARLRRIQREV